MKEGNLCRTVTICVTEYAQRGPAAAGETGAHGAGRLAATVCRCLIETERIHEVSSEGGTRRSCRESNAGGEIANGMTLAKRSRRTARSKRRADPARSSK